MSPSHCPGLISCTPAPSIRTGLTPAEVAALDNFTRGAVALFLFLLLLAVVVSGSLFLYLLTKE